MYLFQDFRIELDQILFKALLLCISCDLPGLRKLLSFYGIGGIRACSKCWKAGFWRNSHVCWDGIQEYAQRTHQELLQAAELYLSEVSNKNRDGNHVKEHFARWNPLYLVPGIDLARIHVIDPMHNLFIGIGKSHLDLIFKTVIPDQLEEIERKIEQVSHQIRSDVGRRPDNLTSRLGSAKAVEIKNFILYYSEIVFDGILVEDQLLCWVLLVQFMRLACSPVVTPTLLQHAFVIYKNYLTIFTRLFGKENVSINFHMCLHLEENMLDYGPISGFWCFAFERLSGELQKIVITSINLEIQIMSRMLLEDFISTVIRDPSFGLKIPQKIVRFLQKGIKDIEGKNTSRFLSRTRETPCPLPTQAINGSEKLDGEFLGPSTFGILEKDDFLELQKIIKFPLNNSLLKYKRYRLGHTVLTSSSWKSGHTYFAATLSHQNGFQSSFGFVEFFFSVTSRCGLHHMAKVGFFRKNGTVENFELVTEDIQGRFTIIPIARIERLVALVPRGECRAVIYLPEI